MQKKQNGFKPYLGKISRIPGLWMALFFIIILISLVNPSFFTMNNLLNVARQLSIKGILSLGMLLVILSGEIDLSVGAVLCITGLFTAAAQNAGLNLFYSMLISLGAGALIGLFMGVLVVKRNLPSFIISLAVMIVLRGYAMIFSKGEPAITGLHNSFRVVGQGSLLGIPNPVIIFVVVTIIFHFLLSSTSFGAKIYAIGSNKEAAIFSGIKTDNIKIWIFVVMGITSALAGLILTARLGAADSKMGNLYELDAIAAVIIGGTLFSGGVGSVSKVLPGIIILGILPNILNMFEVSPYFQYHARGLIIILAYLLNTQKIRLKQKQKQKLNVSLS